MFRYTRYSLSAGVILLMAWQLLGLYSSPMQSTRYGSPLAGHLFQALQRNQLISVAEDWRITLAERDYVLAEQAKGVQRQDLNTQAQTQAQTQWLADLYQTPAGQRVQQQVKVWNYSRRLAAIRDNRPQVNNQSQWQVSDPDGLPLRAFPYVPLSFGYVTHGELTPNFHQWQGASHSSQGVIFTSRFELKHAQKIKLHIIGKPETAALKGLVFSLAERFAPKGKAACPPSADRAKTTPASAYEIVLHLPKGIHHIRLPVTSVANPEKQAVGLALAVWSDAQVKAMQTSKNCQAFFDESNAQLTQASYIPDESVETHEACQTPQKLPERLVWNNCSLITRSLGGSTASHRSFQIFTQDAQPLSHAFSDDDKDAVGKPTEFSQTQGLQALIGQDRQDSFSLSGLLWQANLPENTQVSLTLDSKLQKIAQQTLNKHLKKQAKSSKRRAALVFLKPQTGEILAAANNPNPPANVHVWDRKAISQIYSQIDPYRFNPWQGMTGDNAPGSVFKVVTALAALNVSDERSDINTMLDGVKIDALQAEVGLSASALIYRASPQASPIKNSSGSLASIAGGLAVRASCGHSAKARHRVGLLEATRVSANNWFAHLGVKLDQANISKNDISTANTSFHLLNMANTLGFNRVYSLNPPDLKLQKYLAKSGARGDVLNAFGGQMDLARTDKRAGSLINRLAQNSIGQAMATTPLQMAKVAAVVATGKNIQPQLFKRINGRNQLRDQAEDFAVPRLDWLRDGMKSVVEKGTAAKAFNDALACQVYGKTGTAQVGVKRGRFHQSAWFMGWHEDKQTGEPTLAFACMVTHANSGGGSVCAPIIRDVLKAWLVVDAQTRQSRQEEQ